MLELAFVLPLLTFFALACFQLGLVLLAYISVMNAARDVARWIAVHPNTLDSAAVSSLQSRLPADLNAASLGIAISPACTALTQGKCLNRAAGNDLAVTLTYDVTSRFFLPHQFTLGVLSIQLPTSLPAYTMHLQTEPA